MQAPHVHVGAFEDVQEILSAEQDDKSECFVDLDLDWITDSSDDDEQSLEEEEENKYLIDAFEALSVLSDVLPLKKSIKKTHKSSYGHTVKANFAKETIQATYEYVQYLKMQLEQELRGTVTQYTEGLQYQHKFVHSIADKAHIRRAVKRPKNGFIRFSMEQRKDVAVQYPNLDNREISRMLGVKWRKLPDEMKRKYEVEFEEEMAEVKLHNPNWRYSGVRGHTFPNMMEPIPSRLRPREKLKRKFVARHVVRRPYRRRAKKSATQWVQCDRCTKWRKLPPDVHTKDLPEQWFCEYSQNSVNSCSFPEEEDD